MTQDAALTSSTKPAARPAKKSAKSGSDPAGSAPSGSTPSGRALTTSERAQDMRVGLAMRKEAEEIVSEATALRQRAVGDADRIVAEAEALAADLVAEARQQADALLADARAEAAELSESMAAERDRLHSEIEARVRAELEVEIADRTRDAARLLDRTEADLRDVTPLLQDALAQVGSVLGSIGTLRGDGPADAAVQDEVLDEPMVELEVSAEDEPVSSSALGDDARPLGWLFRSTQG